MKKISKENQIVIYQTPKGDIKLKGDFKNEMIWASQTEIVKLFNVDQSVVSGHVRNIFKDGEVGKKVICKKCILQIQINPSLFIL